jgi:2-C-methyl-D-erythritol 4-phosphate cytidylyltransferase/2-C-methyl-D-erythritol 2,4-cyclodiphosphate synthase
MRCVALILAAGRGERLGTATPKQFMALAGQPLLRHAALAFLRHPGIASVHVVGDPSLCAAALSGLPVAAIIAGGTTRQASALAGLEALAATAPDAVLIHDAARPCVTAAVIDAVLAALEAGAEGAVPAVAVTDTLKRNDGGFVGATVPREGLVRVQTPQGFRFAALLAAHRASAGAALTDDAAVAEAAGMAVRLVAGAEENIKVTVPGDLARAEAILSMRLLPRVGTGFDVHRLVPERPLVLCGVAVPHPLGLAGHSDADVGIHALCDALYGALAEGDIGTHFPPSETRWKDADSAAFLRHAASRVAARGGRIGNVDVTLICERPRIGPHVASMRARLAELLGIAVGSVSVKATTTERLGFAGREEGIAAQAVATLLLPAEGETGCR